MLRIEMNTEINDARDPIEVCLKQFNISQSDVNTIKIHHRALDARAGRPARYQYQIDVALKNEKKYLHRFKNKAKEITPYIYQAPEHGLKKLEHRPIVVGFGPAGMFSALLLARNGYKPLVLERGPSIEERKNSVNSYWSGQILDPEKNVQFGEGGAGAFSDGKLTTRVKDNRVQVVLEELIKHGADPSIAWLNHPHVGTDVFCDIDISIRKTIESLGGEVRFNTRVDDIISEKGILKAVITNHKELIPCESMILAIGHSARDTFKMLTTKDLTLQSKQFAVGVRVEHLQSFIDARQYRNISDYSSLPASEYHLSHTATNKKGVYSFCMCPGGYVVASTSVPNTIVTNGMSYSGRDGTNANSAILVQVDQSDFGDGLLDGMHFQEKLEQKAFEMGNGIAPAQTIASYLKQGENNIKEIQPTYSLGVNLTDLHSLFSDPINDAMEQFFLHTEQIFPGFTKNGALMTGVETRTSSPIRIVRDFDTLQSDIAGLYPCGEGAGYAGGIVSSAIDGIKCAEKIISIYQEFE